MELQQARITERCNFRCGTYIHPINVLGQFAPGEIVQITDATQFDNGEMWVFCYARGRWGFVCKDFVEVVGTPPNQPPIIVDTTPPVVVLPPKPTDVTVVGIHSFATVHQDATLTALETLHKANRPMRGITFVKLHPNPWTSDFRVADINRVSPSTTILHRIWRQDEAVNWLSPTSGADYATWYYNTFLTNPAYDMQGSNVVDQLINEPTAPESFDPVHAARFWNQAMDVAKPLGRTLAILCYSERNPPFAFWQHPVIVALLRRAMREGHFLMLHTYVIDPNNPKDGQGRCIEWADTKAQEDMLYRFRKVYALLPADLQALKLWVAEIGDIKMLNCGIEHYKRCLKQLIAVVATLPYVHSVNVWGYGTGGNMREWGRDDLAGWNSVYIDAVTGR